MTNWQYTNTLKNVVQRVNEDSSCESCFVTRQDVQDWIAAGNTPLDPPSTNIDNASAALLKTDDVALRCLKAGVIFPTAWANYVATLRVIVRGGAGPLPTQPDYPAGT